MTIYRRMVNAALRFLIQMIEKMKQERYEDQGRKNADLKKQREEKKDRALLAQLQAKYKTMPCNGRSFFGDLASDLVAEIIIDIVCAVLFHC